MKRVAVAATVSLATLMAVVLLWRFAGVAALFVISLAVAATVRPWSNRWNGSWAATWHWPSSICRG